MLSQCGLITYEEAIELLQKTKFAQILGYINCKDFDMLKLLNNAKCYSLEVKEKVLEREQKRAKDIQSNL